MGVFATFLQQIIAINIYSQNLYFLPRSTILTNLPFPSLSAALSTEELY